MDRLNHAYEIMRCMGPRWLFFRCAYAARRRSGWDAWRLPVSTWESLHLATFLLNKAMAEPVAYLASRRQSSVRLFFPSQPPAESRSLFADWDTGNAKVGQDAARVQSGEFLFFEHTWVRCGQPPDWHRNPFTRERAPATGHWSRLDEFGSDDIKPIWELSRFGFVFPLVRAYWRSRDEALAECFWQLIEDWQSHNPPQAGVNWKCGQEISFRVMAWCFGLYGFAESTASSPARIARLAHMLAVSGQRIADNLRYALSQRNNHGISEAAGLWTLGTLFPEFRQAATWREMGRAALESQASELIYSDGCFSQHAANYHRVMLENYLWCIQLGRVNGVEFTPELVRRVGLAGQWLATLLDRETGRLPNWGANDGAHILPLSNCRYLDYRPAAQSATMIANGKPCLPPGPWDEQAWWLGCAAPTKGQAEASVANGQQLFPDGGYALLRGPRARALMRCPTAFRHRPAHGDLLHVDVWADGINLLRDGGSYSYNCEAPWQEYFPGVAAHNTIAFDDHDQMPRLSRFLYGRWPRLSRRFNGDAPCPSVEAAYTDWRGARHARRLELTPKGFRVTDRIGGFADRAVLRWRLAPELVWTLRGGACASNVCTLRVTANGREVSQSIVQGWESLYYLQRDEIPVLQTVVRTDTSEIVTEIEVG